jgi:hypothetical protein
MRRTCRRSRREEPGAGQRKAPSAPVVPSARVRHQRGAFERVGTFDAHRAPPSGAPVAIEVTTKRTAAGLDGGQRGSVTCTRIQVADAQAAELPDADEVVARLAFAGDQRQVRRQVETEDRAAFLAAQRQVDERRDGGGRARRSDGSARPARSAGPGR